MSEHHSSPNTEVNPVVFAGASATSAGPFNLGTDQVRSDTSNSRPSGLPDAPFPPEIAASARTLEERILLMLQKAVGAEVEEIRRTYDHKIHQMEEEIQQMRMALAQAQQQLKDVSSRVPFKPVEVNRIALEEFIKSEPLATRLIYSASATATNDTGVQPSKKRKRDEDGAVVVDNDSAPENKRGSTPNRSARPSQRQEVPGGPSSSRPQRRVRTSYKDFGNLSASEDDDDEEFRAKDKPKPQARDPPAASRQAESPQAPAEPSHSTSSRQKTDLEYTQDEKPYLLLFRRPPGETKRFFFTTEQLSVMNEWLIQHLDNPYPTDTDREYLCGAIDLPWSKINTWITNARRRVVGKLLEQRERGELPAIFSSGTIRPPIARRMAQEARNSSSSAGRYASQGASGEDEEDSESDDAESAPAAGDEMQVDAQTASNAEHSSGRDIDLDL